MYKLSITPCKRLYHAGWVWRATCVEGKIVHTAIGAFCENMVYVSVKIPFVNLYDVLFGKRKKSRRQSREKPILITTSHC